jgi:hypothetical protein
MPEITMSGSASSKPVTARCTQSVGVPLTNRKPLAGLAHHQRPVERERVRRAAAVALGRDDGDLGVRAQRGRERLETRSEIAVVVRQEDAHALTLL